MSDNLLLTIAKCLSDNKKCCEVLPTMKSLAVKQAQRKKEKMNKSNSNQNLMVTTTKGDAAQRYDDRMLMRTFESDFMRKCKSMSNIGCANSRARPPLARESSARSGSLSPPRPSEILEKIKPAFDWRAEQRSVEMIRDEKVGPAPNTHEWAVQGTAFVNF